MWDNVDLETQQSPTLLEYTRAIKKMYKRDNNMLFFFLIVYLS